MNQFKIISDEEDSFWILLIWNEEVWKRVYKSLFLKNLNSLFSVRSFEEAENLFLEIELKVAKNFAIRSLSKKGAFSHELLQKMRERGISEESSKEVLSFCQKMDFLNDPKRLELQMQSALKRGRGPLYVEAKNRRSGIVSSVPRDIGAEKNAISQVVKKKKKSQASLSFKEKSALIRFLLGRGFQRDLIEQVLLSDL